jgi:polar amino acid transport system substrate-binding protein
VQRFATLRPGSLTVATAFPDPPFESVRDGFSTGFDIELMRAVCRQMELAYVPVRYAGADFNGIFDGLATRTYDAVVSGTTITAERAAVALFSRPYLQFDQGVAINVQLTPNISGTAGLREMTAGIQSGNTSDIVARKLSADGVLANSIYYAYDAIGTALSDLENGRIGCVIKPRTGDRMASERASGARRRIHGSHARATRHRTRPDSLQNDSLNAEAKSLSIRK